MPPQYSCSTAEVQVTGIAWSATEMKFRAIQGKAVGL